MCCSLLRFAIFNLHFPPSIDILCGFFFQLAYFPLALTVTLSILPQNRVVSFIYIDRAGQNHWPIISHSLNELHEAFMSVKKQKKKDAVTRSREETLDSKPPSGLWMGMVVLVQPSAFCLLLE